MGWRVRGQHGTRIYTLPLGEPETSATARAARRPAQMSKSPACSLARLLASTRSTARSRASTLGAMSASGRTSRARPRSARLSRRRMPPWEGAAVPLGKRRLAVIYAGRPRLAEERVAPARAGEARAGGARGTGVVRVGPSRHHGAHPDALIGTQPPTGLMRPATHSARVFGRSASGIGPRSRKACRWKVESPHLWAALRRASSRRLRPRQASKMLRRRSGVRRSELGLETVQGGSWGAVVRQGGGPFQPSWPRRVELRAVDAARRAAHLTAAGGGGAPHRGRPRSSRQASEAAP